MLWQNIKALFQRTSVTLPAPYGEIFAVVIPGTNTSWLIGPYARLTKLATALRADGDLWEMLTLLGVRIGLRKTDTPSMEERQLSFGDTIKGVADERAIAKMRKLERAKNARGMAPAPSRRNDLKKNVASFWQTQTPQSHHIVEYNNLRDIGESEKDEKGDGEMDHAQLPAVLLAAEFHQCYISVFLKKMHGLEENKLRQRMPGTYYSLYEDNGDLFKPLWGISKVILKQAGLNVA